jgi:hypothetical protein
MKWHENKLEMHLLCASIKVKVYTILIVVGKVDRSYKPIRQHKIKFY